MTKYLVLLEILDEGVRSLLSALREIFMQRKSRSRIHITLRGPYVKAPSELELADWETKLRLDTLLLSGAGLFENPSGCIAYLKVSSPDGSINLSRVTRKFEFPKSKFSFNPHVTVYSGNDQALARRVYNFLKSEQLELVCHQFRFVVYPIGSQLELFEIAEDDASGDFSDLVSAWKVSPDVLTRARRLMEAHVERVDFHSRGG